MCVCVCAHTHMCACVLSHSVMSQFFATSWTVTHQDSLSMGILQARILEWVAMPSSRRSSQPKDWTQVFHIAGGFFIVWATGEALIVYYITIFHELKLWKMALTGVIWHKNNVPQKVCRSCIWDWIWNTLTLRSRRWHHPKQVDCWLKLLWFLVRETELKIS